MKESNWLDIALRIWAALTVGGGFFMWILNRGRKQASVGISKTEAEARKQEIENAIANLDLVGVVEIKVKQEIQAFKEMLWDAQQEHYKVKLEAQERLIKLTKLKNELEQENDLLRNELVEIREEHQTCLREIAQLRKEVEKLKNK